MPSLSISIPRLVRPAASRAASRCGRRNRPPTSAASIVTADNGHLRPSCSLASAAATTTATTTTTTVPIGAKRRNDDDFGSFSIPRTLAVRRPNAAIASVGFRYGSTTSSDGIFAACSSSSSSSPVLDLSAILSPGEFCKKSSWSTSRHRNRGTKSGVDAARRLVTARRALAESIRTELGTVDDGRDVEDGDGRRASKEDGMSTSSTDTTREKTYAITGHGVPRGLLRHLAEAARGWMHEADNASPIRDEPREQSPIVGIAFANAPESVSLDRRRIIRTTNDKGGDSDVSVLLPEDLPSEWERDFELYMVVMDRMASRMVSLLLTTSENESVERNNFDTDAATAGTTGSVVIPSRLTRWDVTVAREGGTSSSPASPADRGREGERTDRSPPQTPTLEWGVRDSCGYRRSDAVVLRLRDNDGEAKEEGSNPRDGGRTRGPISIVFKGEYVWQ